MFYSAALPLRTNGVLLVPVDRWDNDDAFVDYGYVLKLSEIVAFEFTWPKSSDVVSSSRISLSSSSSVWIFAAN